MGSPDIVIAGAGLIGMACALECRRRGLTVTLLERGRAGQEASWAAAGMLAAHDPANPPALQPLSNFSLELYPSFLNAAREVGGMAVPFETEWTLEEQAGAAVDVAPAGLSVTGFRRLREQSLDPRKLVAAATAAIRRANIDLREDTTLHSVQTAADGVRVSTSNGVFLCGRFVDCTGAWSSAGVRPAKGQMLRVNAPQALAAGTLGNVVVRNHSIYMVPRLDGSVVIGATVEDVGFDKTLIEDDLLALQRRAATLLPSLAAAEVLERWAGLRPATVDQLPLIGQTDRNIVVAGGHFRNGILLAPATAHVVGQLVLGETPHFDLHAFEPRRFAAVPA